MLFFKHLSIKSKLIIMMLAVSMSAIAVIGYLGHRSASLALEESSFNHMTSIRASKTYQIESYFKNIQNYVTMLGEDRMTVDAMNEFEQAYRDLANREIPRDWNEKLEAYYLKEFLPKLENNAEGIPSLDAFKPTTAAARFLQYQYLVQNPNPIGKKKAFTRAEDDSKYSAVHTKYHELFRGIVDRFGYYDLFLVAADTGDIVYSTSKEVDFATNLLTGPHRESNLAHVVRTVREEPDRGAVKIADFKAYRASFGAPAAFAAVPVYDGIRTIGILALQLSTEEIDRVMTGNRNWKRDGLGTSGETYLVGRDSMMRSVSRFLIEDPEGYKRTIETHGLAPKNIRLIEHTGTSTLLQEVKSEAVQEALAGHEGTRIIRDYRGISVLSSYAPIHIDGLRWVILAEIDLAEVNQPQSAFEQQLLICAVVMVLLTTLMSMWLASRFVRPIFTLIDCARQVGAGQHNVVAEIPSNDELGELAGTFNEMVRGMHEQTVLIEQKSLENEALLLNIVPGPVAKRLKEGEERIADSVQQCSVLFARVVGFSKLSEKQSAEDAVALLNELVNSFDEAAERHGVEKVKTIGESYMAVVGVSIPRFDHAARAVEFGLEMQRIIHRWNHHHDDKLSLQIGINAGAVMAGVVGAKKFIYDLWGETVNIAARMYTHAKPNTLLVTHNVIARLREDYDFKAAPAFQLDGMDIIATWELKTTETLANEGA